LQDTVTGNLGASLQQQLLNCFTNLKTFAPL